MKIASVGPHLVIPSLEITPNAEVTDYSDMAAAPVEQSSLAEDSMADRSGKEGQKFSRIMDLIEAAKKRKEKRGVPTGRQTATFRYQLAKSKYSGPTRGATYDEEM